jgi:small-conductance mechanosensitive channel
MIVADQPTEEFNRLQKIASEDQSHSLYKNYRKLNINRFIFYHIVLNHDTPVFFYGTEMPDWAPSNVARAFTRMFKHPQYRDRSKYLEFAPWIKQALDYQSAQHWLDRFKIDTLLITRNVNNKKDAYRYIANLGWSLYPTICIINKKQQYVYYAGNPDLRFLHFFHK